MYGQNGMNMQTMQHYMNLQQQLQQQQQHPSFDQQMQEMLQQQQHLMAQHGQNLGMMYHQQAAQMTQKKSKGKATGGGKGKAGAGKAEKGKGKGKNAKAAKPLTKKQIREQEKAKREAEALMGKNGKRRKVTKRNPLAPKRGKSPYIFFSMERREAVKEQLGPDAKTTDIMKRVAEEWNALAPEQKSMYNAKAEADKARYEEEVKHFEGQLRLPAKGKNGKIKDPNAPKRGMSAFLLYSKDCRESVKNEHPDMKTSDISKVLGEKWKALSDIEKQPWVERAAVEADRYNQEKAAYKASRGY